MEHAALARGHGSDLHGFRKVVSTWAAQERNYDKEIVEAALSHVIGGTRGIYQTGDYLKKRVLLMTDLDAFICGRDMDDSNVVPKERAA